MMSRRGQKRNLRRKQFLLKNSLLRWKDSNKQSQRLSKIPLNLLYPPNRALRLNPRPSPDYPSTYFWMIMVKNWLKVYQLIQKEKQQVLQVLWTNPQRKTKIVEMPKTKRASHHRLMYLMLTLSPLVVPIKALRLSRSILKMTMKKKKNQQKVGNRSSSQSL